MWLRVLAGCQLNEGKKSYKAGDVFKIDDARGKRILQADPPAIESCDEPQAAPAPASEADKAKAEAKAKAKAEAKAKAKAEAKAEREKDKEPKA